MPYSVDKAVDSTSAIIAFQTIISLYQEKSSSSGLIRAVEYNEKSQTGKVTFTGRSCVVKASDSDFICDVELVARKTLSPFEWGYFVKYYKSSNVVVISPEDIPAGGKDEKLQEHIESYRPEGQETVARFDKHFREKVGKALIQYRLATYGAYREERDGSGYRACNIRWRRQNDHWSHLY
jgi:hypothetical protein